LLLAGEVARRLYLIEQGCARLFVIDAEGRETSALQATHQDQLAHPLEHPGGLPGCQRRAPQPDSPQAESGRTRTGALNLC
jgi:hypothetical protein